MIQSHQIVVFTLDDLKLALPLFAVDRVLRAVEIASLPQAPGIVLGVINVHGEIIPVINLRRRFRLPEREIDPGDQILIVRMARRRIAVVADTVLGLGEPTEDGAETNPLPIQGLEDAEGVVKRPDGIILVHDIDRFLWPQELQQMEAALGS